MLTLQLKKTYCQQDRMQTHHSFPSASKCHSMSFVSLFFHSMQRWNQINLRLYISFFYNVLCHFKSHLDVTELLKVCQSTNTRDNTFTASSIISKGLNTSTDEYSLVLKCIKIALAEKSGEILLTKIKLQIQMKGRAGPFNRVPPSKQCYFRFFILSVNIDKQQYVCEGTASSARNGNLKPPDQPWKRVSQLLSDISVEISPFFFYEIKLEIPTNRCKQPAQSCTMYLHEETHRSLWKCGEPELEPVDQGQISVSRGICSSKSI